MNVKEWIAAATGAVALLAGIWTVMSKAGYITSDVQAEEIAQQKANMVQKALIDEQTARVKRDLVLQRDLIVLELSYLDEEPHPTSKETRRKASLELQLHRLEAELEAMERPREAE